LCSRSSRRRPFFNPIGSTRSAGMRSLYTRRAGMCNARESASAVSSGTAIPKREEACGRSKLTRPVNAERDQPRHTEFVNRPIAAYHRRYAERDRHVASGMVDVGFALRARPPGEEIRLLAILATGPPPDEKRSNAAQKADRARLGYRGDEEIIDRP
jgi:hypothetical protein